MKLRFMIQPRMCRLWRARSGTTCSVAVSQSSASTQSDVAYVDSGGKVNVQATSSTVTITWNNPTITFTESGLPSGTSWSVTFNGSPYSSTTTTISISSVSPGSYSWSTGNPTSAATWCQGIPSPASGTMSFPSQTSQSISFQTQYLSRDVLPHRWYSFTII